MVDNISRDIQMSVDALPESLVEKEMLIKKIKKVSWESKTEIGKSR